MLPSNAQQNGLHVSYFGNEHFDFDISDAQKKIKKEVNGLYVILLQNCTNKKWFHTKMSSYLPTAHRTPRNQMRCALIPLKSLAGSDFKTKYCGLYKAKQTPNCHITNKKLLLVALNNMIIYLKQIQSRK